MFFVFRVYRFTCSGYAVLYFTIPDIPDLLFRVPYIAISAFRILPQPIVQIYLFIYLLSLFQVGTK